VALLVGRLVLAAVFVVAGLAKLADRHGARHAATDFGVPERLAGIFGIALPLAELAVAVALIPTSTAVWGALAALVLLLAFGGAIAWNLARGRTPDCHCFGALHSEPAGWRTLTRNAGLAGVSVFVLAGGWSDPGRSAVAWIGRLDTAGALAVAALAVAVSIAVAATWAYRRLRRRLEELETRLAQSRRDEPVLGLPWGAPAPEFVLPDVNGEEVALRDLRSLGRAVLLVFADPGCGPCQAMLPDIARWQQEYEGLLTVTVINSGSPAESRAKAEEHELDYVLCDEERKVYRSYEGAGTPSAVLVDSGGTILSALAAGPKAITALVEEVTAVASTMPRLAVGEPVPDVELPSLDGDRVPLTRFRGSETLFLFWSPDCPFCREMHEELLEWEASKPPEAPELVVVSRGEPEEVRAEGFRSTVLLDPALEGSEGLGPRGTPTALLVDRDGRVAWPLVIGQDGVLKLLRSRVGGEGRVAAAH
jgi:peroxiredoxin